jgi:two-component system, cell cycle sensor histidine kinase and response regulator CckA
MAESNGESWDFIESIIENIPDMIFVKDAVDLRFVRFNRAGEKLLGISREEMYGKTDYDFFPKKEADFFTAKDREVLAGGKSVDIAEEPLHTQSGERWLHTRKVPILDDDGTPRYLLGISTDITERRRAESELAEARALLQQREREALEAKFRESQRLEKLGVMAGGIAHDFNNLLVPMLGNASLASETIAEGHPAQGLIKSILVAATQASELINLLLAYAGSGQGFKESLDLGKIVNEVIAILGMDTRQSVPLQVELEDGLPSIYADSAQIRQLLLNLLTNGIDAVGKEFGLVNFRARELLPGDELFDELYSPDARSSDQKYIVLDVEDNGCGMTGEIQQRIFEPFFSTKESGHGLGLAAVHGIVKGHCGALRVNSVEGQGTCIRVALPSVKSDVSVVEQVDSEVDIDLEPGRKRVLVIDDQEFVRDLAEQALAHLGFVVICASGGLEGIRMFEAASQDIDLVLLDMTMPDLGGEEVLKRLLELRPEISVVLSTGYLEQDALKRISMERLAGVLPKPYNLQQLEKVIARWLQAE